jgi:hypothetical protein
MTGQIIEALEIRKGWVTMCILCSGLSALLLPLVVVYMGGPFRLRRTGKQEEEHGTKA